MRDLIISLTLVLIGIGAEINTTTTTTAPEDPRMEPVEQWALVAQAIDEARDELSEQTLGRFTVQRRGFTTDFGPFPDGSFLQIIHDPGYPPFENQYQYERLTVTRVYPPQ